MKNNVLLLAAGILGAVLFPVSATTLHVDLNSPAPEAPYTNWLTAATNIQDAVDAAAEGDQILVTNGVYATGICFYGMSNRVAVTKPVTVQSVNGPEVTSIVGCQVPTTRYGSTAIRCVYLTNGAVLAGFTLTNGATASSISGGGVYCESTNTVVSNCVIVGNVAAMYGGGVYSGTLYNCTLSGNRGGGGGGYASTMNNCLLVGNMAGNGGGANNCILNNCVLSGNNAYGAGGGSGGDGGGAYNCTLRNCTVIGNGAYFGSGTGRGGGTYGGTLYNCILYSNSPAGNYYSGTFSYCCAAPLPSGTGNTNVDPQLASLSHLSAASPCRGAGNAAYTTGIDTDGEPWASPPSMGCDEYWSGSATGALTVVIIASTTFTVPGSNVTLQAVTQGRTSGSVWDLGDGTMLTNRPCISKAWTAAGDYIVTLRACNETYLEGVMTNVTIHVMKEHYVSLDSASPTWPYGSWQTAATNIQDAVDAATSGALVLVSNGVYEAGARLADYISNRVLVAKPITVRSVNGPERTIIRGSKYSPPGWVRCACLTNGAVLAGFTLTNGAAVTIFSGNRVGGGVCCGSLSDVVSNCVVIKNSAGGVSGGTVYNSMLISNAAVYGGGAAGSTLRDCMLSGNSATYGGGAHQAKLKNCILTGNSASQYGGGASISALYNCLVLSNTASTYGGGAYSEPTANMSTLNNCTVVGNRAISGSGGGAYAATLTNCIVYYNTAPSGSNYFPGGGLTYCCTTPKPSYWVGNITNAPLFVDLAQGNLRLQSDSPCINAGNNAYFTNSTDLDGNPRIVGGTVDVGAYECQSPVLLDFYSWMESYDLSTAAAVVYADSDNDRASNWLEWLAGTNPTNAASVLVLAMPVVEADRVTLSWASVTNRTYYVERSTDLSGQGAFSLVETNIAGLAGSTSYTDTNAPVVVPAYYRVGTAP